MLKIGTAFSGIGSPEQALKDNDIEHRTVFACELDKYARQTYEANHTTEKMYEDFTLMDYATIEQLDLFVGGFPCQSFSMAGKRKGFDEVRGTLFFNCAEFIRVNQPAYFILENVKGLLSHDKPKGSKAKIGKTFDTILNLLSASINGNVNMFAAEENLGYNVHYKVLNAKNYGIPQNRERVFIVGIRPDLPNDFVFPEGFPLEIRLKDVLEQVVDEKYYLSDKMLNGFANKGGDFGKRFNPKTPEDTANCLTSRYAKMAITDNYITEPICVAMRGRNPENPSDRNVGPKNTVQRLEPNSKGITNTITSVQKDNLIVEPQIIQHIIPEIVSVRKHEVDIPGLQKCLRAHKTISIKEIAEKLDVPQTMPEHWFRTDKYFSIPDAQYWEPLKKLLGITTTEFDKSITEFEEKENVFEKSNRVYDEDGIAPTITSISADERIITRSENEPKIIGYTRDCKGVVVKRHLKDVAGTIHTSTGNGGNTDQFVQTTEPVLKKVGSLYENNSDAGRIYSPEGISSTIKAEGGGLGAKTGLYEVKTDELIQVGSLDKGFESTGRIYSDEGVAKTLNAGNGGGGEVGQRTGIYQTRNRIRRLTPLECFRLMGFSDEFFYKAKYESVENSKAILEKFPKHKGKRIFSNEERIERMSDSQLYKQAGNSIVTTVIGAIEVSLLKGKF